ncbi:MAG TPA: excinuclease ABC subunit UvrA, partial [Clostridia bacterium]|nr:excinuclease ABC subunit UvrA [Clostridia bacterium]
MQYNIVIKGAREHNLKNVTLSLPRNKLIVLTGLSGSGKSSLAFDTIYAEGQRRYVESLSSYARQFLGQMEKPDVDYIEGLSPAISIDQKSTSHNPRSTVGTVTEIHDYLRLLYARCGIPHCPKCGRPIARQSIDQVVDKVMELAEGTRIQVHAPCVRSRKGEHQKLLEKLKRDGYVRVKVDGVQYDLADVPVLDKKLKHSIEAVIDRLIIKPGIESRLADSIETAFKLADNLALIEVQGSEPLLFSQNYACAECGISIEELSPRMFSFNNPFGACPTCTGLGALLKVDPELVLPDRRLSLNEGAISVSGWKSDVKESIAGMYFKSLAEAYGFSLDTPVCELPEAALNAILYGTGSEKLHITYTREFGAGTFDTPFEGIINNLERRYRETQSESAKQEIEAYMANIVCPDCGGKRLKPASLAVTLGGMNIASLSEATVHESRAFLRGLTLSPSHSIIASQILKELDSRLGFLM